MSRIWGCPVQRIPATIGVVFLICLPAQAQSQKAASPSSQSDPLVKLDLPERLDVQTFVNYVSRILEINIFYDEKVAGGGGMSGDGGGRTITLKAPVQVPRSSLRGLLDSVLKMKGLALVPAEQPGWLKVVSTGKLLAVSRDADKPGPGALAVTQVFTLQHAQTARLSQIIKPFLTEPGANTFEIPEQRLLIVTDYADNMPRIEKMLALVDKPARTMTVEFLPVRNMEAGAMAQQMTQLLSAMQGAARTGMGTGLMEGARAQDISILPDERGNRLVLIGPEEQVRAALKLAKDLDVGLGLDTRVYQFRGVAPAQVDRLVKELIDPLVARKFYRSAIDAEAGILIVTSRPEVHDRIKAMQAELDQPATEGRNPLRFYKLYNSTAAEVLETIRLIEGNESLAPESVEGLLEPGPSHREPSGEKVGTGPNRPPAGPGVEAPTPPMYRGDRDKDKSAATAMASGKSRTSSARQGIQTRRARIVADVNTNSIVVVADPASQRLYEEMIKKLDRRRPQVLIECTIVTVDTSNGFSLGVEISRGGTGDKVEKWMTFSSFGINTVDASTGRLSLKPGLGFNGALLSADIADIILHALETNGRSRVVAAPKILVNDNAAGTLTSVSEAPYTSVNASTTVATTSFAGYATAGTKIKVTPHISEGDHLQLEYSVELSTFSGSGSGGVPPPRQTASLDSKITIPDGYTVAIGGLNRKDVTETVSSLPGLGQIPWLKYLGGSREDTSSNTTLFVFLKPVILRDDRFEDLKYLSEQDRKAAGLPAGVPVSVPMIME